jgi:D-alanine-D-alanine ligase
MDSARRIRVALLFGGRSGEHEVSLRSAASVGETLQQRYELLPVLIDLDGTWRLLPHLQARADEGSPVWIAPAPMDRGRLRHMADASIVAEPDVFFPLVHGTFGEDGTLQGLLELAGVAYVGAGVAASAAGMDKALMKALFAHAGLPQLPYRVLRRGDATEGLLAPSALSLPIFVKPANMGSSVGVTKVKHSEELERAIETAFAYDAKVVVEQGIAAREIEVSVLGNLAPQASLPGEVVPDREFYDYASKYAADSQTSLAIPADLERHCSDEVRRLAVAAFRAVDARGYARVDLFVEHGSGQLFVNEINTIPGFTSISMFPKLWGATGLAFADLLSRLIELAFEQRAERARLSTAYLG